MKNQEKHKKRLWTQKEINILKENFPHRPTKEIAVLLKRSLPSVNAQAHLLKIEKSKEYKEELNRKSGELLILVGKKSRYKKGNVPDNKGQKVSKEMYKAMQPTFFKPGNKPHNHKPVGHQRVTKDGYIEVKVAEGKKFKLLHRFMWEVWIGPIPKAHVISFKDGDRKNCDIENLECIPKSKNMMNNTIQNYPDDLRNVMLLQGKLKKAIERRIEKSEK